MGTRLLIGSVTGVPVVTVTSLAVVAERQRGVRPVVEGVGGLAGLDADPQQLAAPAEGEAQPADAVRKLGGAGA
jgi:hypothetical protein